jgi:hypothetical protein
MTVLLVGRVAVHTVILTPQQVALVTRQPLQVLLILMPCKVLWVGLMPLLVMVMQLLQAVVVQAGRVALLQESLFPVVEWRVVLVLFLAYLAPL